jgi:hypothetical protein
MMYTPVPPLHQDVPPPHKQGHLVQPIHIQVPYDKQSKNYKFGDSCLNLWALLQTQLHQKAVGAMSQTS